MAVFRIDSRPRQTRVRAAVNTAADCRDLISVAGKYLVAVARIDKDAGEIAEWQIAATNSPRCATVMRHKQRLLRSDVNVIGPLRILRDRVDRNLTGHASNLSPRLAAIT